MGTNSGHYVIVSLDFPKVSGYFSLAETEILTEFLAETTETSTKSKKSPNLHGMLTYFWDTCRGNKHELLTVAQNMQKKAAQSDFWWNAVHKRLKIIRILLKLAHFFVSKYRFLVGQSLGETETKNQTSLAEIPRPIGKSTCNCNVVAKKEESLRKKAFYQSPI